MPSIGACTQLRLLLGKNWILKKRTCCSTFCEIIAPIFAALALIGLRFAVSKTDIPLSLLTNEIRSIPNSLSATANGPLQLWVCGGRYYYQGSPNARAVVAPSQLAISPRYASQNKAFMYEVKTMLTTAIQQAAQRMILPNTTHMIDCMPYRLPGADSPQFLRANITAWMQTMWKEFDSADDMAAYTQDIDYARWRDGKVPTVPPITMGIVVDPPSSDLRSFSYDIRPNASRVTDPAETINGFLQGFERVQWEQHIVSGVAAVQNMIDQYIINKAAPAGTPSIKLNYFAQPMPIPDKKSDLFGDSVGDIVGLLLILTWLWPFSRLVRNIVDEKENRIRELLKMQGLSNTTFWASWAITYLIMLLISSIIVTAILGRALFSYTNQGMVFAVFFLFSVSVITFGLFISAFFSRAKTAGVLSMFALIVFFLPYFAVSGATIDRDTKRAAALCSPVAFSLAIVKMLQFESAFQPLNNASANDVFNNYAFNDMLGMLILDIFLYLFLAWYCDNVVPSEFGTSLPWYFPVTKDYWLSFCERESRQSDAIEMNENMEYAENIEKESAALSSLPGLKIRGLRREFPGHEAGKPFVAVHNLNLNFYQGQISVLLGHNGAGKSTTINCLTGLLAPTAGTANAFGKDLVTDIDEVRRMIGVCPQHDVIFPSMTVSEHLELYARLKGVPDAELATEVRKAIEDVQLSIETNQAAGSLSGGQKRRLCLAIALIGGSKVVFLDEPTSGVDPFSRRAIWDLLTKSKKDRVIVLSTHFMDEADSLGDRVAIMHHGKLRCCGSPLFLKSKFGVGYNMTFTMDPAVANIEGITSMVKQHVPDSDVLSSVGSELSFRLPVQSSASFPALLHNLDQNKPALGFFNYGVSVTTLEEVFLRVAHEGSLSLGDGGEQGDNTAASIKGEELSKALEASADQQSFSRQMYALLLKRWNYTKRDQRAMCCGLVLPLLILAFGLGLLRVPVSGTFQRFILSPSRFNQPVYVPFNSPSEIASLNAYNTLGVNLEAFPTSPYNLPSFVQSVLDRRLDHQQSRYGAYFSNSSRYETVILTNQTAIHAIPVFQNVYNNLLLRNITGSSSAAISTAVHPWKFTKQQMEIIDNVNGIFAAIVIAICFCFVPASYAVFIVKEKETKAKHLQFISGVGIFEYWFSNLIWDIAQFTFVATIGAGIVAAYNNPNYVGDNLSVVYLDFYLFGLSVIPFTYLCSFMFSSHSTAQNVMIMIYLIGGVALVLLSFALYSFSSTRDINDSVIRFLFRLIPNYCSSDTIFYLSLRSFLRLDRWDLKVSGYNMIFMAWEGVVYFCMTLWIEWTSSRADWALSGEPAQSQVARKMAELDGEEDADVAAERERVKSGAAANEVIRLEGLRKVYGNGKVAVNDLWFSVPKNQCFGFLGVNGAGKSTTIKICTGDEIPNKGNAFLGGYSVLTDTQAVRRVTGYCPQNDCIFELLNAVEHLELYGRIRGIPEDRLPRMIDILIKRLTLDNDNQHLRPAGTYSGGNKRKLSLAIALVGSPTCVFLDEPTTGVDPVSRRFLWNFLSETMQNRSVILTTHDMAECEALSSRIGIMVLGKLKCIGSSQHLKNKFGKGFQIDLNVKDSNFVQPTREFLKATFADAQEVECFGTSLKYKIGTQNISLGEIFSLLERNKVEVGIEQYACGQATLESIFVDMAQTGEDLLHQAESANGVTKGTIQVNPNRHGGSLVMEAAAGASVAVALDA